MRTPHSDFILAKQKQLLSYEQDQQIRSWVFFFHQFTTLLILLPIFSNPWGKQMSFKHAPKVTADVCLYIYIHWNLCTLLICAGHVEHTNPSHLSPQQRFTGLCTVKTLLLRLHWPLEMYYRIFTHLLWSIVVNKLSHIDEWSTFHVIIHKFICFTNCRTL